jgi:hypothetical protein
MGSFWDMEMKSDLDGSQTVEPLPTVSSFTPRNANGPCLEAADVTDA